MEHVSFVYFVYFVVPTAIFDRLNISVEQFSKLFPPCVSSSKALVLGMQT